MGCLRQADGCRTVEDPEGLPEDVFLDLILDPESVEYVLKAFRKCFYRKDDLMFGGVVEASASAAFLAVECVNTVGLYLLVVPIMRNSGKIRKYLEL